MSSNALSFIASVLKSHSLNAKSYNFEKHLIYLGGGNSDIFMFTPTVPREMIQFDERAYFFNWVAQPPCLTLDKCITSQSRTAKDLTGRNFRNIEMIKFYQIRGW